MTKKNYFDEIEEIIKKRNKWVYLALGITFLLSYFLFFYAGIFLGSNYPSYTSKLIKNFYGQDLFQNIKSLLEQENYMKVFFIIVTHNFSLSLINLVLGLTFLFPFILILINGSVVGLLSGIIHQMIANYSIINLLSFYMVLLLEASAMILSGSEGLQIIYSIINPRKTWKIKSRKTAFLRTFKESIKILLIVFFILFVAGIIETISIYYQLKNNMSYIALH